MAFRIVCTHKMADATRFLISLKKLYVRYVAQPRSIHMQQSFVCHLQGIQPGDAWMIYDMPFLRFSRVKCSTVGIHSKPTMHGRSAIHSYITHSTLIPPCPTHILHTACALIVATCISSKMSDNSHG